MPRIVGTVEDDLIQSPLGRYIIRALAGNDTVLAADSWIDDDIIYLGNGDDMASGFKARETIYGGRGNDTIESGGLSVWGGAYGGSVKIFGEGGNDHLSGYGKLDGGNGNDTLTGGGRMIGGQGDDVYEFHTLKHDIVDRQGKTVIDGSLDEYYGRIPDFLRFITADGRDQLKISNLHDALVKTGDGGDNIYVNGYEVEVIAGNGNDTVYGGTEVFGGDGRDDIIEAVYVDGGRHGDNIGYSGYYDGEVRGGDGNDIIRECQNVHGDAGADQISYSSFVWGDEGNDVIEYARIRAFGGAGDDFVGGWGLLRGDNGDDTLYGQKENGSNHDTLEGGRGADELLFGLGKGDDILRGGKGVDTFTLASFLPDEPAFLIKTVGTIEDFEDGTETIDVSVHPGVTEFADLVIEQSGADVLVKDQDDYVLVVVADQLATDFSADDFIF